MSYYRELVAALDVIKTAIEANNTLKATIAFERQELAKAKINLADARLALARAKEDLAFVEKARTHDLESASYNEARLQKAFDKVATEVDEGWTACGENLRPMRAWFPLKEAIKRLKDGR